jgi:hypothetical protein
MRTTRQTLDDQDYDRRTAAERRLEAALECLRQSAGTEVLDRLGEHLEAICARLPAASEREERAA